MGLIFKDFFLNIYSMENNQEIKIKIRRQRTPKFSNLTDEEKKLNKTLVHRKAIINWKKNHREQHLEHRRREYNFKKIKFIFLNILL